MIIDGKVLLLAIALAVAIFFIRRARRHRVRYDGHLGIYYCVGCGEWELENSSESVLADFVRQRCSGRV